MYSLSCMKPATCFSFQYAIIRLCIKKQNVTAAINSHSRLKSTTFWLELMTLVWPTNIIGPNKVHIQEGNLCMQWKVQVL